MAMRVTHLHLPSSNVKLFYREQGLATSPVLLMLHGFPSSSHQYRKLIPLLSQKYRLIAPDLPGFGFTEAPSEFKYSFATLADTIAEFLDALSISKFAIYIFDYGAPVALRIALKRPNAITAIVTQSGNAYEEGLGSFWDPIKDYWSSGNSSNIRSKLKQALLTFEATKWQYEEGSTDLHKIMPESYWLDYVLLQRPGNADIQLDLFKDYENNVKLYPEFQKYFRQTQVPLLAVWGQNDPIFSVAGVHPFIRDLPGAEIHLLDAGHFAAETDPEIIAHLVLAFFEKKKVGAQV
ncbi:hydrolase [Penicillium lagena]|uniref:hydrolase n=1 Tax=Penicillium lagena TaxID=94218 RepID=UPI0025413C1D|nr:hydrolase [Penicillium lagena]KAJ5598891.1 hydrolase [Penicillium lagena]